MNTVGTCGTDSTPLVSKSTSAVLTSIYSLFLSQILRRVREAVGPDYPVGIKLNSADFQKGGFEEADSLQVLSTPTSVGGVCIFFPYILDYSEWLEAEGVDLVEVRLI